MKISEFDPFDNEEERLGRRLVFVVRLVYLALSVTAIWIWGWKAFWASLVVAVAMILNGIMAEKEDREPGGFLSPNGKEIEKEGSGDDSNRKN